MGPNKAFMVHVRIILKICFLREETEAEFVDRDSTIFYNFQEWETAD